MLKVTIYNGGQMTAWPVFARCNGGQKTVSPKQNGLLTTGHRSNRWSRGRWSEGGTPVMVVVMAVMVVNNWLLVVKTEEGYEAIGW